MVRSGVQGIAAGAVGTSALDATAYLDMLVRDRAASDIPEQAAGQLAEGLGIATALTYDALAGSPPGR